MRPGDSYMAQRLDTGLAIFDQEKQPLIGIHDPVTRKVFIEQILESIRRVKYVSVIQIRNLSERNTDPNDEMFDPVKAAVVHHRRGDIDEAFWMVFLFVHFGKNLKGEYRYIRDIYGSLGGSNRWDWVRTSADPMAFRKWLDDHQAQLKISGVPGGFGNHRKYQSLDAYSPRGTGAAVETYVNWVGPTRQHKELFDQANIKAEGDPKKAFHLLYQSMDLIAQFGRIARFDYLAMIGKLGLAYLEPDSPYLQNSNGPLKGAKLLFGGEKTAAFKIRDMDRWLVELGAQLGVGMQVLEDSICNWQKSPAALIRFRG